MKFTLGQFIDAIEKNGLPQTQGATFRGSRYNISPEKTSACALGQGVWNILGRPEVLPLTAEEDFWTQFNFEDRANFTSFVVWENDEELKPLPEIARLARIQFEDKLDQEIEISYNPATMDTQ